MKKRTMHKKYPTHAEIRPDITGMINKMQEQLLSLERKIDTLIGRSSQKPTEVKPFPKPFQRPGSTHGHGLARPDNSYRERILHKAICADCNKECEVPFKPSGGRPVYCKECFSKRKTGSPEGRPAASYKGGGNPLSHPQVSHINRPQGEAKKRHAEKKRPAAKRRKARA